VAIASGKGGVGKTNASVNLSIALTRLGKRTTLVDADIGTANADVLCGLSPKLRLERAVGADNVRALHEIAIDAPGGFRLVPGSVGIGRIGELDEGEQDELVSRLIEVERTSDIVLIDTSAGLGESVRRFIHAADLGIIVATPEPTSIAEAYALIKVLVTIDAEVGVNAGVEKSGVERAVIERPNAPKLAVLLNQVANEREAGEVHGRIAGVCQRFLGYQLPMLGYIRKDKRVPAAVLHRVPVMVRSPRCHAAKDYLRTAEVLTRWSAG
jgi:flagellar biosynthesis protein FlhG